MHLLLIHSVLLLHALVQLQSTSKTGRILGENRPVVSTEKLRANPNGIIKNPVIISPPQPLASHSFRQCSSSSILYPPTWYPSQTLLPTTL